MKSYNIILASASPRRIALIKQIANLHVTVRSADIDESLIAGEDAESFCLRLARQKAESVQKVYGGVVLGADTVVCIDGEILNKPRSHNEAEYMFRRLCGKTHEVMTGVCIASQFKNLVNYEKSYVTFGAFDDEIVYNYINSGLCMDKAGGYGIQDEQLSPLIKKVEGNLDNVIGLSVSLVKAMLAETFGNNFYK